MKYERTSGLLLHVQCLPNKFGIGDVGPEAYKFVDILHECQQKSWQILPLNASDKANPYSGTSAFAGHPLLISLEKLAEDDGLLTNDDLKDIPKFNTSYLDFDKVYDYKYGLLKHAYENFKKKNDKSQQKEFENFCKDETEWIDDYTLYMAIRHINKKTSWTTWDTKLKTRDEATLEKVRKDNADLIMYYKFLQYIFFKQWAELRKYTNNLGIKIIGDMAVYVDLDSADVWANQELFQLDPKTSLPNAVSGAPPDGFSAEGQLWNNPLYDWDGGLKKTNYKWWVGRVKKALTTVDILRIDHFRGLEAYWAIPIDPKTGVAVHPKSGKWIKGRGDEFLHATSTALGGNLPLIAEDLGYLTQEVFDLRDKYNIVGMRVLQFAFELGPKINIYLPHHYVTDCVAYTGTHDNDTAIKWFKCGANEYERKTLVNYLQKDCAEVEKTVNWDLIRLTLSSVADTAVLPIQDVCSLENDARLNDPSGHEKNWLWRFKWEYLTQEAKEKLKELTYIYGR
ncbi:unnamed protein product [Didymodactylos carnosus]|uniref:4-alpha-glucanotransferase n=1 Tax=Didymodactylos carnosus TaxID=1234261 RepID=A0A814CK84_9BILA|nr:unnamed protein product [Didymodactylos carnosus]CAF1086943.1 unnamed protein product [Didymodactylos carnosus]CAF3717797.1 unnamed protein product [Didymodactylos carnosus]CAF3849266.1 unnamed protein product [Didymodactylos carnosus]